MIKPLVRIVRTIVPAASVALAVGILVTGCSRPQKSEMDHPGPGPTLGAAERGATIVLKRDQNGTFTGFNEPVSDDPKSHGKHLGVSKTQNHTARWLVFPPGADVTLAIQMDNGNAPFDGPIKCRGNDCASPRLVQALTPPPEGTEYPYSIKIKDNKTGTELKMDPIIRVDP